jgi:RNA polymerase sigma factor (TIGR02999 family)
MSDAPTDLLARANGGDPHARDALFALIYDELRRRASAQLGDRPRITLSTTALVHEAYLKLFAQPLVVNDRKHLFRLAAQVMRQVLIDRVRASSAAKRGGEVALVTLTEPGVASEQNAFELLALEQALDQLENVDARLADVATLHLFVGLEFQEISELLATSERSIYRDWRAARMFLRTAMDGGTP